MNQPLTQQEERVVNFLTNVIWYGGFITLPILIITWLRKKRT